jgi:hypothetical protein
MTRSPTVQPVTSAPTASTTPAPSFPIPLGNGTGYSVGSPSFATVTIADNPPALAVYRKLGFQPVYEYWYRSRP